MDATDPRRSRFLPALAILYLLASGLSLALIVMPLLGIRWGACAQGLVGLVLPWVGAMFYAGLAVLAIRSRDSALLALAPGVYVFAHAALVVEMVRAARPCPGCLAVAVTALAAAGVQLHRRPQERLPGAAALVLGIVAGFFSPFDRSDELLTRKLWPARLLEAAPAWVDRDAVARCGHPAAVRLVLFEKDCRSCGSWAGRFMPRLAQDFPAQVCVHLQDGVPIPQTQRLPLLILVSQGGRVSVIEGAPDYDELKSLLRQMVRLSGEPSSSSNP